MRQKVRISMICMVWVLMGFLNAANAQLSTNTVKYKVTYVAATQTYTAWVVPDYNVPNANNANITEKGGTAQFTIVVPKDFVITEITDIKGTWSKPSDSNFRKFGPGNSGQTWTGLDPALNYYVIGKTPSETDYGTFTNGTSVALFSFKGNGCFGPVKPLPAGDPFIQAADDNYSLNVANSFYSRSGQPAGGNVNPLEQFVNITGSPAQCAGGSSDLSITKTLTGAKVRTLNETVTYRLVVRNQGPDAATNVVVKDSVGTGLVINSATSTVGTFTSPLWTIPTLASGDSAVLTVTTQIVAEGVNYNYGIVKSQDQTDPNKSNNDIPACVSVPYKLCTGNKLQASVPAGYTNVVWYKGGTQIGTGNSILLSETGSYTFTASNATCPVGGCCPVVIETGTDCCPVSLCVPVVLKKLKG